VIDAVVIGGGQAGLAASSHLRAQGIDHVVLERGRVAETWRTSRWDGFHLNTPNWATQLPGMEPLDSDPDGFAPLAEVIAMLEAYARHIDAPVHTGAPVSALRHRRTAFELEAGDETILARSVVVATGAFQQPTTPPAVAGAPESVLQLHTSAYRRPGDLPDGGVLIVGSGQSGCEIGQELLDAGHEVHLALGRCGWAPRRYRGRELVRWLVDVGLMDETADVLSSPAARVAGNVTVSGARGGVDCNPVVLEAAGAHLHGRLTGFRDGRAVFADDLEPALETGRNFDRDLRARCDEYARQAGLDLPEHAPIEPPRPRGAPVLELPLDGGSVNTILWANGFRPAFGWIDVPVFDEMGFPRARRGVTDVPGLVFLGLPWLHTRRSSLLLGIGGDAEHVAGAIASHLEGAVPA
jgi:putative flavoprotein involved in K+ transport